MSVHQQAGQLRELFALLPLEPRVRAYLDVALRAAEGAADPAVEGRGRLVEAVTPTERQLLLGLRHAGDADAFLAAYRAGTG